MINNERQPQCDVSEHQHRCTRPAFESLAAAGTLGLSKEQLARHGEEAEQILRERDSSDAESAEQPGVIPPSTPILTLPPSTARVESSSKQGLRCVAVTGGSSRCQAPAPPLGRLEDRKVTNVPTTPLTNRSGSGFLTPYPEESTVTPGVSSSLSRMKMGQIEEVQRYLFYAALCRDLPGSSSSWSA